MQTGTIPEFQKVKLFPKHCHKAASPAGSIFLATIGNRIDQIITISW
jgi:hypothetical protein